MFSASVRNCSSRSSVGGASAAFSTSESSCSSAVCIGVGAGRTRAAAGTPPGVIGPYPATLRCKPFPRTPERSSCRHLVVGPETQAMACWKHERIDGRSSMNLNSILIGSEAPQTLADYYTKLFGEPGWADGGYTGWQIGSGV